MVTKKIRAYTLMEITVAMLLVAVCMSICYAGYGLIEAYFKEFQKKNAITQDILALNNTMDRDFLKASYLIRTADGIKLQYPAHQIFYHFGENAVLRTVSELRTDSFHLRPADIRFQFKGKEANEQDTVDQVIFYLDTDGQPKIPVTKRKLYSAQDLLR